MWDGQVQSVSYLVGVFSLVGSCNIWEIQSILNVSCYLSLRYTGVIRFVFHVGQLLLVRSTQWNLCCTSKYMIKHLPKSHWKLDLSWFRYGYRKCMFCWILHWIHKSLWLWSRSLYGECGVVNEVWRDYPVLFRHVLYGFCSLILT